MLNLNDLHVFVQVVDHGGFAAASRALNMPKSTLSKRVQALEEETGVRLIQRTSRSFVVTELGREFYRHAAAMVIEAEAAENVIKGRLAEPSGMVRITTSVPSAQRSLAPLLPRIAKAYPKLSLELHVTDRFVDVVQEGFDIAIRNHFAPLPDSGLVQRRIVTEDIWLIASPGYVEANGVPALPADIDAADGILVSSADREWSLTHEQGAQATVRPLPRYFANEGVALIEAAKAGLGVACVPGAACVAEIEAGRLHRILPEWRAGQVISTLLIPSRRGQLPSVRVVADLIVEALSRRPAGQGG